MLVRDSTVPPLGRSNRRRIDSRSPEDLGIPSPLWSRRAVRDLIRKELGISMPVRTVGEYLRRWGDTAKRPRRHARKQDPEEVRHWPEEAYPALEYRAKKEEAEEDSLMSETVRRLKGLQLRF